jgi:hypothetical protein
MQPIIAIPVVVLLVVVCGGAPRGAGSSIKLDGKKQLFLDDYLISSVSNVSRQLHAAQKYSGNPVLWSNETWEKGFVSLYGSVLEDDGKYRLWYQSGLGVSYAESQDGIRWTKPRLDLVKFEGQPTNVLAVGTRAVAKGPIELASDSYALPHFYEMFGVLKDPQEKDPSRRYKMAFLSVDFDYSGPRPDPFHEGQRRGLGVAGSPDGIRWKLIDNWTTDAICDGGSHWMFDPVRSKYIFYGRTKFISPNVAEGWGLNGMPTVPMSPATHAWVRANYWGRSVARLESSDFLHWDFTDPGTAPVVLTADLQDSRPGTEIYDMMVFPYESVYIGLVKVWHRTPEGGPLEIELAVSHDTHKFTRVADRSSLIPVGPIGTWDRFTNSLSTNAPLVAGDTLRLYYSSENSRHSPYKGKDTSRIGSGIGFATVQLDRFVSLAASFDGGQIVTKPMEIKGKVLHLNATSDFGEILVEALDKDGRTVAESKPVQQDALDIAVEWKQGSLGGSESPVTLRITLKNAHLYAIWST